jgi:hypothetical protein
MVISFVEFGFGFELRFGVEEREWCGLKGRVLSG